MFKKERHTREKNIQRWNTRKVVLGSFFDTGHIDLSPFSQICKDYQSKKASLSSRGPLTYDLSLSSKHDMHHQSIQQPTDDDDDDGVTIANSDCSGHSEDYNDDSIPSSDDDDDEPTLDDETVSSDHESSGSISKNHSIRDGDDFPNDEEPITRDNDKVSSDHGNGGNSDDSIHDGEDISYDDVIVVDSSSADSNSLNSSSEDDSENEIDNEFNGHSNDNADSSSTESDSVDFSEAESKINSLLDSSSADISESNIHKGLEGLVIGDSDSENRDPNCNTADHDDNDRDCTDHCHTNSVCGAELPLAMATPPVIRIPRLPIIPALVPIHRFTGGKDCPIINSPLIQYLSPAASKGTLSVRQKALALCNQEKYLTMEEFFTPLMRKSLKKLGEGVFGEVYSAFTDEGDSLAIKIMPIDGKDKINDERQKTFEEILPEMVISKELSDLGNSMDNVQFYTKNFVQLNRMSICTGQYPEFLLYAWDQYDEEGDSDNDRPDVFSDGQLFILFAFENSGHALESFVFHNQAEARSVIAQIAGTLAVGEGALGFEHRDMHRGNVLVKRTREEYITFIIDSVKYVLPSEGVKVTIIDYTLSRIQQGDCISFNDLNNLPWLFEGKEGLQHQTYLHMKNFTGGDWSKFTPQTNAHWLHYAVNRMAMKSKVKNLNRRHIYSALRPYLDKFTKCDSAKQVFIEYFSKPIPKKIKN